jgi:hypothetical protein
MDLAWFEMSEIRRRKYNDAVWVPLRASETLRSLGHSGTLGSEKEFFGLGSVAIPLEERDAAERLGWDSVGIGREHISAVEDGKYLPADVFEERDIQGVPLVLDQRGNREEKRQWHLHQDFVIALGLQREGDVWVAPNEAYTEVARLHRNTSGDPIRLDVRAEYLKDYLSARKMALYVNSYRNRVKVVSADIEVAWLGAPVNEKVGLEEWEGSAYEIHEGGMPFGSETAVFHAARTDVDASDDVPVLGPPTASNIDSSSWVVPAQGQRLLRVQGELWRSEWVEPATQSRRIAREEPLSTVSFTVDANGTRESAPALRKSGRWLWFKPEVMSALAHRRGGAIGWYTRDTGYVRCSPDYDVHFGVNSIGLINVYAKDIAFLPEWQQRIWAGYNVGPEGAVSEELLESQVRAEPARTQAPEEFLSEGIELINRISLNRFGFPIFRHHDSTESILSRTHRFRATDAAGLFALAKDVARLTADRIDVSALQKLVLPPKGELWGSLKSLEKVLGTVTGPEQARLMTAPLVGAYELRLGDAHLPRGEIAESLRLAGVDASARPIHQGEQLLSSCVSSLYEIAAVLDT